MTQFWKRGLFRLIGLILLFLMTSKGIEPGVSNNLQTQDAAVGEDVTLDCHVGPYLINFIKTVEWKFNDEVNVLVYKSKDFSRNDQEAHFRDRASKGDSWDFKTGELPVKIKSLQESDAGIYCCSVSTLTGEDPKEIISIKLNVNEAVDKEKQAKDQTMKSQSSSPVILILCLLWFWQRLHY